ncbi:MAG: glycosyltransferase [Clostridia bacterium]|nr:glycosyltransferase [Clostridia bacterium]
MKKIIIVNNNMKIGGVQKSLYNLLWALDAEQKYEVTLLLFRKTGLYAERLPDSVKVVECSGPFRYLGMSQSECGNNRRDKIVRSFLAGLSRICGRSTALYLMLGRQPAVEGTYDCAIAYLHNGRREAFYGGVQEFVLERIQARRKIAFLHGDYRNCGADHKENHRTLERFDQIAACSDGCRQVLESVLPHLKEKCVTVQNCHRFEEIRSLAEEDPPFYDKKQVNVVMVSRLTHEKGMERALEAAAVGIAKGLTMKLHIVGSGPMEEQLRERTERLGIQEYVVFYGEQTNPYRYMNKADLLLITSYHEAAPMIIDEARILGIPTLTTATTSSTDMVLGRDCGWVCENSQEALNNALYNCAGNRAVLEAYKTKLLQKNADNSVPLAQFCAILES